MPPTPGDSQKMDVSHHSHYGGLDTQMLLAGPHALDEYARVRAQLAGWATDGRETEHRWNETVLRANPGMSTGMARILEVNLAVE